MPNLKSAKKRLKQNKKAQVLNQGVRTLIKSSRKRFMEAIELGKPQDGKTAFAGYCSALDKATKHGVVKKNNATRSKQRAAARLVAIS